MIKQIMGIHQADALAVHFFTGLFPTLRLGLKMKINEINAFLLSRKKKKIYLLEGFEIFFKKFKKEKQRK